MQIQNIHLIPWLGLVSLSVFFNSVRCQDDCGGFQQGAEQFVEVQYRTTKRRGSSTTSVTEAEVFWQPTAMLTDPTCYDLDQTTLLYKPVDSDIWIDSEVTDRPAGKSAKWIVKGIKPCLEYQFQIKVVGSSPDISEAMFELPKTLGPATEEETVESDFIPDTPEGFEAKVGANTATLSWSKSDCATSYEVSVIESGDPSQSRTSTTDGGETKVSITELKPCKLYEVTLYAVLGDKYSEDLISSFATKPRLDAIADLNPTFQTSLDSAVATWETWKGVSCISEYEVTVCNKDTGECHETETVSRIESLSEISHSIENLEPCSTYTFKIQPVYAETEIESRTFEFKTKSPSATSLTVESVSTDAISSSTMQVSWSEVQCASSYRVYQKAAEDNTWNKVAETTQFEIPVDNITPCTKYHFAISAVLHSGDETEKTVGPEMISDLDENDPFDAPNLYIVNADDHADVSWGHADCITSYVVKVCQTAYTDCLEASVDPEAYIGDIGTDRTIRYKVENLDPCTLYSLEIIPVITGKSFTARAHEFTTTNGIIQPPENFKVVLNENKADLTWSPVQCATGYKIYQRNGDPETHPDAASTTTQALEEQYSDLVPCENYFYAVSSMVDEQESVKTEWMSISIPAQMGEAPELKVLSNENDTMTIKFYPSGKNEKCSIAEYEVSYSSDGGMNFNTKTLLADQLPSDDIPLTFEGATSPRSIVRGRVKYTGVDKWSPVVSTHKPGDHSAMKGAGESEEGSTVVPIVIGIVVAIAIVGIVAFIVVRRRRNRSQYDAEKAETNGKVNGNSEETQKLKEDATQPEA